jgi:hypothetical protein
LNERKVARLASLVVIGNQIGRGAFRPVGEALGGNRNAARRAKHLGFVDSEQTVHRGERRQGRIAIGRGEPRRQFDRLDPNACRPERALDRRCREPQRRIAADDGNRFHSASHKRASAL